MIGSQTHGFVGSLFFKGIIIYSYRKCYSPKNMHVATFAFALPMCVSEDRHYLGPPYKSRKTEVLLSSSPSTTSQR